MSAADPAPAARAARYSAPAAACAADVLITLARAARPLATSEIAMTVGVTKSLVYRVLAELECREFVTRNPAGAYSLGLAMVELGGAVSRSVPILTSIRRQLRALAVATGETVSLGVLRKAQVLYVMREEGNRSVLALSDSGKLLPAHACALGKALLAEYPDSEVQSRLSGGTRKPSRLPALTPHTLVTMADLRTDLEATRRRGHATEQGEVVLGRTCVAVAIPLNLAELDTVGVSISMTNERAAQFAPEAAGLLTELRRVVIREARSRVAIGTGDDEMVLAESF